MAGKRVTVFETTELELQGLGKEAAGSALAATALALARDIDKDRTSATAKSMCAKALIDVLREVRSLAPPRKENDGVTSLTDRRAKRLAGLAATADSSRP